MKLQFRIQTGSPSGQVFDVRNGMVIGRATSVDISLSDRKVSGQHAKVELDSQNEWVLTDLGSTNGIRVESRRVSHVQLAPGVTFQLGNTVIAVIAAIAAEQSLEKSLENSTKPIEPDLPSISVVPALENAPPPIPVLKPKPKTKPTTKPAARPTTKPTTTPQRKILSWHEYLSRFAKEAQKKVRNRPQRLFPFNPLLVLTVVRGLQIGTQWVMGYGPREIGLDTLEFHLLDSPPLAFRVTPHGELALYETPHPKQVRLNGSSASTETLHEGDEIQISDTIIKVSYRG